MSDIQDDLHAYFDELASRVETNVASPRVGPHRRQSFRRVLLAACLAVVIGAAAVLVLSQPYDEPQGVTTTPDVDAPSPLFGAVEQLTPASLPEGWARCSGGRSTYEGAGKDWWSQTFGPVLAGKCTPRVTVTQLPPDDQVDMPVSYQEGKLGGGDVERWIGPEGHVRFLFAWAIDQNLLVEACCGESSERLDQLALASVEGLRQRAPARCTGPESDLDREDLVVNHFGRRRRMFDRDGCPIRTDIASLETLPADHHCSPGLSILTIGTPLGASIQASRPRSYLRNERGVLGAGLTAVPLDLDAELPPTAVDTGYRQDGRALWIDEGDDMRVYLVDADGTEAWPLSTRSLNCG